MLPTLHLYNTLSRRKEEFVPLNPPFVGLYLCGPTVYGDGHLGHARSAITFDVVVRYLRHRGYRVRYVRNITDVGHLERDADHGDDKIGKLARLQQLEPMEVAQRYTNSYHDDLARLGCLPPDIEPTASGHIIEQIAMVQEIIDAGLAYEVNGSVYFDVERYHQTQHYGKLSGRVIEDLLSGTRETEGLEEKRGHLDFALWKKAQPEHIMRWTSPWGEGFPGWHIECSAMSRKYLGETFDIHGGGMDLLFPHHECEIAQSNASHGHDPVRYWMHNNMVTVGGQKMGKSLGNAISLKQIFSGDHPLLAQAYAPMVVRFFILQAHYRSTLDFGNEALQAAAKGYNKLMNGLRICDKLVDTSGLEAVDNQALLEEIERHEQAIHEAFSDDFNTAVVLAELFALLKKLNTWYTQPAQLQAAGPKAVEKLTQIFRWVVQDLLGLHPEMAVGVPQVMEALLSIYAQAKADKNYTQVDSIRAQLKALGIVVKDMKTGIDWAFEE